MLPRILIVNDDGIEAPGLRALYEAAKEFGDIYVVAPRDQQSASSHSVTIEKPLFYDKVEFCGHSEAYAVSGTPVDCVKIALNIILKQKPTLVLSGINWGANLGASVIYSGTVGAALEATFHGIPAIAFSQKIGKHGDFGFAGQVVKETLKKIIDDQSLRCGMLNINIPNIEAGDFRGYRVTHQTNSAWEEEYQIKLNGNGEKYYVLCGELLPVNPDEAGDIYSIRHNYVSITPITPDFTNYRMIGNFKKYFTD